MSTPKRVVVTIAVVVVVCIAAASCSSSYDTAIVGTEKAKEESGVSTTTVLSGLPSTTTSTTDPKKSESTASDPLKAGVKALIAQLAANPQLVAQLTSEDPIQIAMALGVDPEIINTLQISGSTISRLGTLFNGADPAAISQLVAGQVDPALLNQVLSVVNGTDPSAFVQAAILENRAISSLLSATQKVNQQTLDSLRAALRQLDPDGLGSYATSNATLSLLAILFAAALATDPGAAAQLQQIVATNSQASALVSQLRALGALLDASTIETFGGLGSILDAETLRSLTEFIELLSRPEIKALLSGNFG